VKGGSSGGSGGVWAKVRRPAGSRGIVGGWPAGVGSAFGRGWQADTHSKSAGIYRYSFPGWLVHFTGLCGGVELTKAQLSGLRSIAFRLTTSDFYAMEIRSPSTAKFSFAA
jgi:hypothetical protein